MTREGKPGLGEDDEPPTAHRELEPLSLARFSIEHAIARERVTITLKGNADSDVASAFAYYLERLHNLVVGTKLSEIVVDCRELYFLTASCVQCLFAFIRRELALDARARYRIRLLTTPS